MLVLLSPEREKVGLARGYLLWYNDCQYLGGKQVDRSGGTTCRPTSAVDRLRRAHMLARWIDVAVALQDMKTGGLMGWMYSLKIPGASFNG